MATIPKRKRRRRKRKPQARISKFQRKVADLFRLLLGDLHLKYEVTWPWLKNPDGNSLYADIYFPRQNIVIEAHGIQHYKWPNPFHKTYEDFQRQQQNDRAKKDLIKAHGITYVAVSYDPEPTLETIRTALDGVSLPRPHVSTIKNKHVVSPRLGSTTERVIPRTPAPA